MKLGIIFSTLLLLLTFYSTSSCKKFKGNSTGNIEFSIDTLVFDTIFTTIGSTTQQFKLYNRDNKPLKIDEVELMGGSSSPFRMNLDGLTGLKLTDIEIPADDSLFCFVEVTLQVNGQNLPLVIEDSIRFRSNGVDQYIILAVWGQDVYYHYSNFQAGILDLNEGTWPNDKPHLIYGAAIVDSAKTLNIQAGTQIYLHKGSILYNYKGTLNFNGSQNNRIVVQGDRLETFYDDVPGQYYGIYYHQARPSTMEYVLIKNAISGVHLFSRDEAFSAPTLTMKKVEIKNPSSYGLFLFDGPQVVAENVLSYHSGIHALLILKGADYTFTHCNFMGYGPGDPTSPAVGIRNYFLEDGITTVTSIYGQFNNCVIDGYGDEQLVLDTINPNPGTTLNFFDFNNTLIKATANNHSMFSGSFFNQEAYYLAPYSGNFKFSNLASALSNTASSLYQTSDGLDIEGTIRGNPADLGVYDIP